MAARAHDVAALTIKGSSAILNFPELAASLPRPASKSPQDVQAAAMKAASMEFPPPPPPPQPESPVISSSSSCSSLAATAEEEEEEELGEIVKLPRLDGNFEFVADRSNEFVFYDVVDNGWCYPRPWLCQSIYDDQQDIVSLLQDSYGLESSLWLH
ncbi:hypothetical protein RIF29_40283 [Crotalaria pallida]|uniref:Uncharacterized protein n=1 Tax=Crotalaria pallida TaxID=3830 RepID=A0AAN9E967_CROPI